MAVTCPDDYGAHVGVVGMKRLAFAGDRSFLKLISLPVDEMHRGWIVERGIIDLSRV